MYRICAKNFDGTINRVLVTHVFDTYDSACEFIERKLGGAAKSESGTFNIRAPLTIRCQREVKHDIVAGRATDNAGHMIPYSGTAAGSMPASKPRHTNDDISRSGATKRNKKSRAQVQDN